MSNFFSAASKFAAIMIVLLTYATQLAAIIAWTISTPSTLLQKCIVIIPMIVIDLYSVFVLLKEIRKI